MFVVYWVGVGLRPCDIHLASHDELSRAALAGGGGEAPEVQIQWEHLYNPLRPPDELSVDLVGPATAGGMV